jgi:hypothetical protein
MSVILYGREKFDQIFATMRAMRFAEDREDFGWLFDYPQGWQDAEVMDRILHAFVCALARANAQCWNETYKETQPALAGPWRSDIAALPDVALYKSLCGLRYNLLTNGGRKCGRDDVHKRLDSLIGSLSHHIIGRLPEYERADTW